MTADASLKAAYRQHWGRLLALLVGQYRRLDLAEDALSDAFEAATRHWPAGGVPANPPAWLLTAARRRAVDRLRAEAVAVRKEPLLVVDAEHAAAAARVMVDGGDVVEDDLLRLASSAPIRHWRRSRPAPSACGWSSACRPATWPGSSSSLNRRWPRG